jgi:hypothetical protein
LRGSLLALHVAPWKFLFATIGSCSGQTLQQKIEPNSPVTNEESNEF